MTMGASWNARLDVPISDAEALETLDKAKRDEFLDAIERDSGVADKVIEDAAAQAEGGIITRIPRISIGFEGEPLTIRIEREANRVLAERRAQAAIPAGRTVPGLGVTTEGMIYEPAAGGRLKPTFVSVVIAEGRSHRLLRRRGRYILQTLGGRAVDSGDNLALLLLLFALLEKKRRDAERKRDEA